MGRDEEGEELKSVEKGRKVVRRTSDRKAIVKSSRVLVGFVVICGLVC